MKLKVGILGASGYAGNELVRILSNHDKIRLSYLSSQSNVGQNYADIYPNTPLNLSFKNEPLEKIADELDLLFTATPHNFTASLLSKNLLEKMKIIDLSADFRLKNPLDYECYYGFKHGNLELLKSAVYGLCEINKQDIKKASLIANPGCYTTCSILSLYPLIKANVLDKSSIIIDAKSGVSGAGRGLKVDNLFCEVNENIKAYSLCKHRHTPEIEEQLSYASDDKITLQFTPHLIPMQRGILTTIYVNLSSDLNEEQIREIYAKFYENEPFIRLLPSGVMPQTRWVSGSNFVYINFAFDTRTKRLIIVSALDNLIKGAAGAAVQNMNLMFGFDEKMGLESLAGL